MIDPTRLEPIESQIFVEERPDSKPLFCDAFRRSNLLGRFVKDFGVGPRIKGVCQSRRDMAYSPALCLDRASFLKMYWRRERPMHYRPKQFIMKLK